MSYCVNCGVELGKGTRACPLCGTPVLNPNGPEQEPEAPFFPTRQEKVKPVSKKSLALLLTSMLASVAVCCGLLNLALRPDIRWSLYAVGGAIMLWIFFVPPLLWRQIPLTVRIFFNVCAVGLYVLLIALACDGLNWYLRLALPILGFVALIGILVGAFLRYKHHSMLVTIVALLLGAAAQCLAIEFCVDRFLRSWWGPGWSLIVLAVCVGLSVPLIVVRCVSSLREEARRRFHV